MPETVREANISSGGWPIGDTYRDTAIGLKTMEIGNGQIKQGTYKAWRVDTVWKAGRSCKWVREFDFYPWTSCRLLNSLGWLFGQVHRPSNTNRPEPKQMGLWPCGLGQQTGVAASHRHTKEDIQVEEQGNVLCSYSTQMSCFLQDEGLRDTTVRNVAIPLSLPGDKEIYNIYIWYYK